ncbi:hypothetical protein DW1_0861 [Proteiniborus sp. DW1]|uniref:hypothetical protein n=1 Tax=Proteiniborus sp. DW1 TaxID=1889883 RepID=UPI00092E07BC|nr:hypothetical protein [Proteiniborus sp. DW1]SCG82469.1 hypothetical protein DW1_0861 [Proteiniborus sp. DW1]
MKKRLLAKLILMLVLISYISTFASADQRMDTSTYVTSNHTSIDTESPVTTEQENKQEPYVEDGVLMCSCGIPYFEHLDQNKNKDEFHLLTPICGCGGKILTTVTKFDWFYTKEERKCIHHHYGHDYEMERKVVTKYSCNNCSYLEYDSYSEYKWECKGW